MYTVVLVDDEPWVARDIMQSVDWGRYGFDIVATFTQSAQALEEMAKIRPDLAFIDIQMPGMTGFSLIEACQSAGLSTRYIMLTGHSDFGYMRAAMRLGVSDYCLKPVDPEEIENLLSRIASELDISGNAEKPALPPSFSQLLEYVRYHSGETLRLAQVADTFNFNKNYLCTLFKKHLHMSFVQYLTSIRLENSCQLLRNTDLPVEEIAARCNLGDAAYFGRVFKKQMRTTPVAYRKKSQNEALP